MTDRWLQPIGAALSSLGFDPTANGGIRGDRGGDPTQALGGIRSYGGGGYQSGFGGFDPLMDQAIPAWDAFMQAKYPTQQQSGAGYNSPTGSWSGTGASQAGGQWALLDQQNDAINSASQQTGTPANLIKGVLAREGSFGRDFYVTNVSGRSSPILAYNGVYQETAISHGLDWNRMISDRGYAAYATGKVLADLAAQNGGDWNKAAADYFGVAVDELGNTQSDYLNGPNGVLTHWRTLDAMAGNPSQDPASPMNSAGWGGGSSSLSTMFGAGASVPDWGEFNVPSSNGLYGYGLEYGLNGSNHTGVDVPMPVGSQMRAPTGGTVLCAGTGNGTDSQGGSCTAFNNTMGGGGYGAGRIEVRLDNGAVLIFGHASGSAVQPGQRVSAGQLLGYSGGMNSPHVHLEARVMRSDGNWQIVDPRSVLGGGVWPSGNGSYSAAGPSQPQQQGPMDVSNIWLGLLTGQYVPGYSR